MRRSNKILFECDIFICDTQKDLIRIELSLFTNETLFFGRYLLFVNLSGLSRVDTPQPLREAYRFRNRVSSEPSKLRH